MLRALELATDFSITKTRAIIKDLFRPSPAIYWADFLGTFVVGSICYALVRRVLPPWSIWQALAFAVAVVLYYRAALFVHELTHLRDGTFRWFRIVWNLLCGIPFLMPSFMYYSHVDHHTRKHYGTAHDGEYLPLASTGRWSDRPLPVPAAVDSDLNGSAVPNLGSARLAQSRVWSLVACPGVIARDGPLLRTTTGPPARTSDLPPSGNVLFPGVFRGSGANDPRAHADRILVSGLPDRRVARCT